MDPAAVPLIRVADLTADGATRAEIATTLRDLERLAVGIYAQTTNCPEGAERHLLRARAVIGRVGGCVASHVTAAAAWRLPLRPSDHSRVHVSPIAGRRGNPKKGPGYHFHSRHVADAEVMQVGALPVTTPLRTVLDCARALDRDWGVVIADAALRADLVSLQVLREAAVATRNAHGSSRARSLAGACSELAESPAETLLRLRLRRMGLQAAEQVMLEDVEGRPRVDFLVDGCLVIEFDGESKYVLGGDVARAHWLEKQRHDRIIEGGYEVLRVTWAQLWDEPALRARVMQALRRAERRGRATPS
jgi:very-short-patch-repair endonuclease